MKLWTLSTLSSFPDPEPDDSPVKAESSDNFERNYSGQRGVRSVPIAVREKDGASKSLNPFIEDKSELDYCPCDVSTQTELAVTKKDNCKLM